MPHVAIAAVAAVATIGGTVMSLKAQSKQAKQQRIAMKFERQKAELQSARQKMDVVRQGRISAAEAQQAAENQGVSGTSAAAGGVGSIISQVSGNLSFLDEYGFYSDQASKHLQKAANQGAKASMWAGVAELGSKVYQASGGIDFTGPKPPAGGSA